jgi:hypothetical protein
MATRNFHTRGRLVLLAALTLAAAAALSTARAGAVEGPREWLARIFDPSSLGIKPFPGSQLNRKLSVDAIQLERGGSKRIAIYTMPLDRVKTAADDFAKQLGTKPHSMGVGSKYETYVFDLTGSSASTRLKGLRIEISRSQFVDNRGQITMEYTPPAK